jgi:hypothetical protein
VNITLVNIGPYVIALPDGADITTMEGLKASMQLFTPANFLFPFLGHALGTLTGAFVAAKIAGSSEMKYALGVGLLFFLGGLSMIVSLGGPLWFNAVDLLLAYLPMAWLGGKLASGCCCETATEGFDETEAN